MRQIDQPGSDSTQNEEALVWRRRVLFAGTSLAVASVRNRLQYGSYGWASIAEFAVTWLLTFVGLFLTAGIYYGLRGSLRPKLLGKTDNNMDEAIVEFFSVVLLSTLIVFFFAEIVPRLPEPEPW